MGSHRDVFHSVSEELMQNYLNECCYRFNRRYCDKFERLMVASVGYQNSFMHRVYTKKAALCFNMKIIIIKHKEYVKKNS